MTDLNAENMTPEEASAFATHKAKSAAAAVELSREVHLQEAIQKTALETKAALLEGLKEVFGDGDEGNPVQMRILVRRIPILCTNIEKMHEDLAEMKSDIKATNLVAVTTNTNLSRVAWLVLTAVVIAVLKLVLIP